MKNVLRMVAAVLLVAPVLLVAQAPNARDVHDRAIVVDTHADTTQRLIFDPKFNIAERHGDGNIDIPRMRDGGMDALFFSIWVPSEVTGPIAVKRAFDQIDAVREAVRQHPDDSAARDHRRRCAEGRQREENRGADGCRRRPHDRRRHPASCANFAALGVRYMTLTHFKNNNWADSSTDKPQHNGLTAFGKDVVREMNRLGMMVDISHVADKTFFDVLALTTAPVIASHSSSRAIAKHPRNMTDEMMKALAKNGGVIMINYHAGFLSEEFRVAAEKEHGDVVTAMSAMSKKCGGNEACTTMESERIDHELMAKGTLPKVGWEKIVEHIDHAVKVAGADHVGLGSDFDGATMPLGMEDVSKLPKITEALLAKGYTQQDVTKILGGNILRVMEAVEHAANR